MLPFINWNSSFAYWIVKGLPTMIETNTITTKALFEIIPAFLRIHELANTTTLKVINKKNITWAPAKNKSFF